MTNGLYLPDGTFMCFSEPATTSGSLSEKIAVRSRSIDYYAIGNMYLPNPDPVLKAQGKDIQVYNDLRIDDRVSGSMTNRFNATLALDWQIDKGKSSKSRQAKAVKAIFDRLPLNRIMGEILQARSFGYAPLEIVWGQRDGLTVPVDLQLKPQRWFVFGQVNDLRFRSRDHLMDGEELPPRKFLCPTNESSYDNPYGLGLLSRCFWPVVFKKGGWRFWIQFSEKYGQVWPIGKLPRTATPEQINEMLDILSRMIQDGVSVIPDDGSVDFKESGTKGATSALYKDIIAEANNAISTVWLGHAGAGESVSGELGGGKGVAVNVRDDLRDSDKSLVEEALNQLIDWICEVNWNTAEGAPRFSLWEEEEVDGQQAARDKDLTESLSRSGLKLTRDYFLREYNLEDGDIEDAPAQPQPSSGVVRDGGPQFAEPDPGAMPAEEALFAYAKRETAEPAARLIDSATALLGQVDSLEEFRDKLIDLYADTDPEGLGLTLARLELLAERSGRLDMMHESE